MKNVLRYVISLIIPAISFLIAGFILGTYVNKCLSLYFFIASGVFLLASLLLLIVTHAKNKKGKK